LQAAIEGEPLARHRDVVRRAVVVDENDHLSLGDVQVLNTELQALFA
jgi:hypothetical protein